MKSGVFSSWKLLHILNLRGGLLCTVLVEQLSAGISFFVLAFDFSSELSLDVDILYILNLLLYKDLNWASQ